MRLVVNKSDFIRMGVNRDTVKYLEEKRLEAKLLGKAFVVMVIEEQDNLLEMLSDGEWRVDCLAIAHYGEPKKYVMRLRVDERNYGTFLLVDEENVKKLGVTDENFSEIKQSWFRGLIKKVM